MLFLLTIKIKIKHGNESWEDKHRCEESRKHNCRIVKDFSKHGITHKGWCLFVKKVDFDWGATYMTHVSNNIKYCPFCGEELL